MLVITMICASCRPGEMSDMAGTEEGLPATVRLEVRGEEEVDVATRTVNEDAINDMHVLIYNNAGELIGQKYQSGGRTVTVNTRSANGCTIYVIANTADANLFKGYDIHFESTLKNMVKTVSDANTLNKGTNLPMTGSKKNVNISTGANSLGTLKVTRMAAKINLNIKAKENSGITISEYTIYDVPLRSWYIPRPLSTESETDDSGAGEDAVSPDNNSHWANTPTIAAATTPIKTTFYMFENRRGVKTGITQQKDKNTSNAPNRATYVYIKGKIGEVTATWKVYLGANNITNFNIKRNKEYTCNITLNDAALTDTRMEISFTAVTDLSAAGTANCYLASKTCTWYKFKATVRGNGAATAAEISPTGSALSANAAISPASAELVWETGQPKGIIQSVSLTSDKKYVLIKTGHLAEGNAVVAVKDAAGNILWSWHIWKTAFDLNGLNSNHTQTYRTNPRTMNASLYFNGLSARNLVMMDRDLGAAANTASNTDNVVKTFGLYYQFGRKDPFPTARNREIRTDNNSEIVDVFDKSGNKLDAATLRNANYQISASSARNVAQSIQYTISNPLTFILANGDLQKDGNWIYGTNKGTAAWKASNKLWGSNFNDETSGLRLNTKFVNKTIYDPCPSGWCVPLEDTWTNFTTTTSSDCDGDYNVYSYTWGAASARFYNCVSGDNAVFTSFLDSPVFGRRFYINASQTAFYPAAGARHAMTGLITNVGKGCYEWASSPSQEIFAVFLDTGISWVAPLYITYRAYAFPVRCVREDSLK